MSLRESFSGVKKDIKQRFKGVKRKLGRKGAVPGGDEVDSLDSGPQSVGGSTHEQGASVVGEPVDTAGPSVSRDGPAPASAGETDEGGGGTDIGRTKVSTIQESDLLSHTGVSVGTGYDEEVEPVHPSPSFTPAPRIAKPNETAVVPDNEPKEILPEGGANTAGNPIRPTPQSVEQDRLVPESEGGSEAKQERGGANIDDKAVKLQYPDVEPLGASGPKLDDPATATDPNDVLSDGNTQSNAGDERKSNWKSTMSSTAKLLLRGVRDASDAFGPLKSVAGGLCFILENCERTKANKQTIESLAPRVKALSGQLCEAGGDIKEANRRKTLQEKLEKVLQELKPLKEQGNIEGFFTNTENADKLGGLVSTNTVSPVEPI